MKNLLLFLSCVLFVGAVVAEQSEPRDFPAHVVSVYDGDSLTALVDLGFETVRRIRVRLSDIDTPEIRGKEREDGIEVRDYVRGLILDQRVILTTDGKKGKYGRYLCDIRLETGELLSVHLLEKGHAQPYE